jgi:hypothetical protein
MLPVFYTEASPPCLIRSSHQAITGRISSGLPASVRKCYERRSLVRSTMVHVEKDRVIVPLYDLVGMIAAP